MSLWKSIQIITIVCTKDLVTYPEELIIALEDYWGNGITVSLLLISSSTEKKENEVDVSNVFHLNAKDLSVFRKKKNERFHAFQSKKMDAVFVCGDNLKKIKRQVDALKSNLFVGINTENDSYEINLQTESFELLEMVNFAQSMISKIARNE